jgi:hypothetical protein
MSDNNNNNPVNNNPVVAKNWKMYASLVLYAILGLALGYAVAKGVLYLVNRPKTGDSSIVIENQMAGTKKFTGNINSVFEGDNKAEVSFSYNDTLTVEQGVDAKAKYFYIKNATGTVATIYASFEGGRGYSENDYLLEIIKKAVPSVSAPQPMVHGSTTWAYASTAGTEWNTAPFKTGNWVMVVENKKVNTDMVKSILDTMEVK